MNAILVSTFRNTVHEVACTNADGDVTEDRSTQADYPRVPASRDKPHRCPRCWAIPEEAHRDGMALLGKRYECDKCAVYWIDVTDDTPHLPCPECGEDLAPAYGRGRHDRDGNEIWHRDACRCRWCEWWWSDDGPVHMCVRCRTRSRVDVDDDNVYMRAVKAGGA